MDKLYGHHGTRVILDQCSTKVSFRQSDADIAKRMSSFFGQREFIETQEGLSYGAHRNARWGQSFKCGENEACHFSNTDLNPP